MKDYIERAGIMARIAAEALRWGEDYDADQILGDIEDFPAADVRPVVRGKWYWDNYKYDWTCYACGWPVDYHNPEDPWGKPEYSYCPNCGALNKEDET